MIQTILFLIILAGSLAFFAKNVLRLISYLKIGKAENRTDRPAERIRRVLTIAFGQSKLLREPFAGIMHFFIFWGFVVLFLAILEAIGEGIVNGFSFAFLGPVYGPLVAVQEVLGILVIVSVCIAILRRYINPPPRLEVSGHARLDATLILLTILVIMCSMFLQNAAGIVTGTAAGAEARFFSSALAGIFSGSTQQCAACWFNTFWWIHILVVLGFLNYLPYSKHLHIISSIPNVYLAKLENRGSLKNLNLADETLTRWGAADVEDLTWKQLLDGYTCTECGRCTAACPANITGKLLSPKKIVMDIRHRLLEKSMLPVSSGDSPAGTEEKKLVDGYITEDELWACTTCMACVQA